MEAKTYKKFTRKTTLQVGKLSGNVPVSMCSFSAIGLTIFFLVCNYWVQNFFIEEWSVGLIAESSVKIYIYYGNCTSSILLGSFYYYYHFDKVMKIKPFYANALLSLCSWKKKKIHRRYSFLRISYFVFKESWTPLRLFLRVTWALFLNP